MSTAKEFYLDLTNSENNILDLSEYKGKKIKISVEDLEDVKPIGQYFHSLLENPIEDKNLKVPLRNEIYDERIY